MHLEVPFFLPPNLGQPALAVVAVAAYGASMPEPTDTRWSWRERVRDPRFLGILALLLASAVLASAVLGFDAGAATFAITVGASAALFALPRWRDPKHRPAAGAAILCGGAALMLALALVVR